MLGRDEKVISPMLAASHEECDAAAPPVCEAYLRHLHLSTIQLIVRQTMVQDYNMNSVGVRPADFVLAPDVTSFDISEFTRADEMASIGEATTDASVGNLREMLSRLDFKLFETGASRRN